MLEEEKNALLDYIEESVNMTASAISPTKDDQSKVEEVQAKHRMTINDMQSQIASL